MLVEVAEETVALDVLNLVLSFTGTSKFVPLTVTAVPGIAILGVKLLTVGAPLEAVTVKEALLVADPLGAVTLTCPVAAALGTVATSCVAVAAVTVAEVPLKLTLFWFGVVLKAVPLIVTEVPTGPLVGVNPLIDIWEAALREIDSKLPTAS